MPELGASPSGPAVSEKLRGRDRAAVWLLRGLLLYLVASTITLPFIGKVWIGEIPLLALFQFPKLNVAHWFRRDVVMPAIRVLGLSQGSFSPDYLMARPYGLLLAYLVPGLVMVLALWMGKVLSGATRRLLLILFGALIVDYFFVMIFGSNGFLIY